MFCCYFRRFFVVSVLLAIAFSSTAQSNSLKLKYKKSSIYAGIEVGSKGVKMSIVEIQKNAKKNSSFNVLKDTSVNSDFISFSAASFQATLSALSNLYIAALKDYQIPTESIFTVVSSGVKTMADKEDKVSVITKLVDSFKVLINEPAREMPVVDVTEEARLSHLGIVPESRRYNTFLIDIGSGNTKGGYFPNGDTKTLKLFQLSWGTKSIANATEKRCDEEKSLENYSRQLSRVLSAAENSEIIYRVNESGAYPMSDFIAFSGGISWAISTLAFPELVGNSVIPVTYEDILKFSERVYRNYYSLSDAAIMKSVATYPVDKEAIAKEVKSANKVFDQRALMAGTGLLLKIMRQFEGVNDRKQFFLIKNGQVGWISAYVDQHIEK